MSVADQSILQSVKMYSMVPEETTIYDDTLIALINSGLNTIKQLGVGPPDGYAIEGADETWGDTGIADPLVSSVADYIKISVNLKFDPPSNSFLVKLRQDLLEELVWRITNDYSCGGETDGL